MPNARPEPARILVAEHDTDSRAHYRDLLQLEGYEVREAADGRDALIQALVHPPDLVLTAARLPLIDGLELCEILRRDRTTAAVPILIVAGDAVPTTIARAAQTADTVLVTPTSPESIVQACASLLAEASVLRARATTARTHAAAEIQRSTEIATRSEAIMRRRSNPVRITSDPPVAPPQLKCPKCGRTLAYEVSYLGGVNDRHREQWDYYICACGAFRYRHRSRKLMALDAAETSWVYRHRRGA